MRGLTGQTAIITGGLGDLGYASARRLVEEGCHVALFDHLDDTTGRATAIGCDFHRVDISDEANVVAACAAVRAAHGPVTILVNSAACFIFKTIDATCADWQKILSVNIMGTSLMAKHVVPQMREAGHGSIINFSSVSGIVGQAHFATYNATKFAIRGLTMCWAQDFGLDKIRVNSICPGYIRTFAFSNSCKLLGIDEETENQRVSALHLLGRQGRTEEVASAVAFLASDESSFITGSDLLVDGGYLAR